MKLKDIASVAGKPGLYRVLKPTRSGMIVETLEAKPKKTVMNATHRVSILQEISIYTTDAEESVDLGKVLKSVHDEYKGKEAKVEKDSESLSEFMAKVLPNYDKERVYTSDIKKLASWYNILIQFAPDSFEEEEKKEEEKADSSDSEKEEKKPAKKKAPAKKKTAKKEEDTPAEKTEKKPAKKATKPKAEKKK